MQMDKVSEQEDLAMKEAAAKDAGRIIKDEADEIIKVELSTYNRYMKFAGGWCIVVIFILIMSSSIIAQLVGNYYT